MILSVTGKWPHVSLMTLWTWTHAKFPHNYVIHFVEVKTNFTTISRYKVGRFTHCHSESCGQHYFSTYRNLNSCLKRYELSNVTGSEDNDWSPCLPIYIPLHPILLHMETCTHMNENSRCSWIPPTFSLHILYEHALCPVIYDLCNFVVKSEPMTALHLHQKKHTYAHALAHTSNSSKRSVPFDLMRGDMKLCLNITRSSPKAIRTRAHTHTCTRSHSH